MNFYTKHARTCPVSGDRIRPHKVYLPNSHAEMIRLMGRPRDDSPWDWLTCALADAVNAGTLFPDIGEEIPEAVNSPLGQLTDPRSPLYAAEAQKGGAWNSWVGVIPRMPFFPERVFRAFARLSKAHGLTPSQGIASLVAWHYRRTGENPARVSASPSLR